MIKLNIKNILKLLDNKSINFQYNNSFFELSNRYFNKVISKLGFSKFIIRNFNKDIESKKMYKEDIKRENLLKRNELYSNLVFDQSYLQLKIINDSNISDASLLRTKLKSLIYLPYNIIHTPFKIIESDSNFKIFLKGVSNRLLCKKHIYLKPGAIYTFGMVTEIHFNESIPVMYNLSINEKYSNLGITIVNNTGIVEKGSNISMVAITSSLPVKIDNFIDLIEIQFFKI